MRGGCDAELGGGAFVSVVCETGLNAERVDGDGAVSSGGVPGLGTASRTVGVPGVGVVPTVGACAFGATRRGETGVGPACVGETEFGATGAASTVCVVPLVVRVGSVRGGALEPLVVGTVANVRPNRRAPNARGPGRFGVCRVQAFS